MTDLPAAAPFSAVVDSPCSREPRAVLDLHRDLTEINFTVDGVTDLLGERAMDAWLREQPVPARVALYRAGETQPRLATVIALFALVGSLTVRRRRIWVRLYPQPDGTTRVETGGLARTDRAGWGSEYEDFHAELLGVEREEADEELYFDDTDRASR